MMATIAPSRRILVAVGLLILPLWGCGAPEPSFHVLDARVTQRTDAGFVVSFTIEGANPGPDGLPLREVRYSLALDGTEVFHGVRSAGATLPRKGEQTITLPAAVAAQLWSGDPVGATYTLKGDLSYISPGAFAEFLFDAGVRRPTVSFEQIGLVSATPP